MDVVRILIAILLPPLGVFLQVGIGLHFWLNILLTLVRLHPGHHPRGLHHREEVSAAERQSTAQQLGGAKAGSAGGTASLVASPTANLVMPARQLDTDATAAPSAIETDHDHAGCPAAAVRGRTVAKADRADADSDAEVPAVLGSRGSMLRSRTSSGSHALCG